MPSERRAVFLIDLVQDVNILRPLALLVHRELGLPVAFLHSAKFTGRDASGCWRAELQQLAAETQGSLCGFESEFDAWRLLAAGHGLLVSASETDQPAHQVNHAVFRLAPPGYLRVTVQHGYECIGFLPNREHIRAHGRNIRFAADVICGWCAPDRMTGTLPEERSKLYAAGPPLLLLPRGVASPTGTGLVCENLHSVRLRASGDFRMSFMETFFAFCRELAREGERVTLRPHPAGQYFHKNAIALPETVDVQNAPAYRVDFSSYQFGISAPSSVLIDMLLAQIPVAVWQDERELMDAENYNGLTCVSTLAEWLAFRRMAQEERDRLLTAQARFLARTGLLTDPAEVRRRYLALFGAGEAGVRLTVAGSRAANAPDREVPATFAPAPPGPTKARRIMFVVNAYIPSLQVSFLKPLMSLREAGELDWYMYTENDVRDLSGNAVEAGATWETLKRLFDAYAPHLLVFCRYSGRHAEALLTHAQSHGVPVIYHVDDDLLGVPIELGEAKWKRHNHPSRLAATRHLLRESDLVYVSTAPLRQRFEQYRVNRPMRVGAIYCAAAVINPAEERPVRRVGYMGFKHSHDFAVVVPALERYLERHPEVVFELFGTVPKPAALDRFGDQIRVVPPIHDYHQFTERFAAMKWDIGLCALAQSAFNSAKANTKWVEYTSVGAAVIASRGTVYDECTADGCGLLAGTSDEWFDALERLTLDPGYRFAMVKRAQRRIVEDYSIDRLRDQVLSVFDEAAALVAAGRSPPGLTSGAPRLASQVVP